MSKLKKVERHVLVCVHKHCLKEGGRSAGRALKDALKDCDLGKRVLLTAVDCLDQCGKGPIMVVYPDGVWYGGVDERAARRIAEEHLCAGRVVTANVLHDMKGKDEG